MQRFTLKALALFFSTLLLAGPSFGQIGNCYRYLANNPVSSTDQFQVGQTSGGAICLGCNASGLANLIDEDPDNYVAFGTLINLFAANGIAVKNTSRVYPAGTIGGFNIDLGANLLNGDFLNAVVISTYKDGVLQESQTGSANLFAVPLFGSTTRRSFIYIHTSKAFNELRFEIGTIGTFLQTTRVHYAFTIDPDCNRFTDSQCDQLFAGNNTDVSFNGQLLSPLASLQNAENLNDADRYSYASLTVPAGAISGVSAGVTDLGRVVEPGGKVGFVIAPDGASLFSLATLNSFSIETYYYGKLQESKTYNNGTGLLNISALALGDGSRRQRIAMTTTRAYNEVRLKVNQLAGVNVGSVRIYYAFHEKVSCDGCESKIISSNSSPYKGSLVTGNYGTGFLGLGGTPWTGRYGLALNALSNTNNVTDNLSTNYATYTPFIGVLGSGANITVKNDGPLMPVGTFAGFKIQKEASLIDVGLFDAITVVLYNGTTITESKTGSSLLSASLLSAANGQATVGFVATKPFNRIRINFNDGLISAGLGGNYRIYYAYAIGDADGDGVEDCNDLCPGFDDNVDNDGDGLPDCQNVARKAATPPVESDNVNFDFKLYPNPVPPGKELTISGPKNGLYSYRVYTHSGVVVTSGTFTDLASIQNLRPGKYHVHIFKGAERIRKHTIVVNQ